MELLEAFWKNANEESKKGLAGYLDHLIIDARPPARLKKLLLKNPWEDELLKLLIPLFEASAGFGDTEKRCAYITAPRGHSKTSILAMLCNWALVYAKHTMNIVAAAADRDQAQILISRCKAEAQNNPWLKDQLAFKHYEVLGPQGQLQALSADAPTSSGLLCDLYLVDELSWHPKDDLINILFSGKDKRPTGCFIIISNAGEKDHFSYEWLQMAKKSPRWICHEVPPMSASWLDEALIEDQRSTLPLSLFRRLHLNIWTTPGEDNAFVTREQLNPCLNSQECLGSREHNHVISIDYGMTNDRTALCVCHADENGVIILDTMNCWQGNQQAHVQIGRIEEWIQEQMQAFRVSKIVLDAFQLEGTAQKFEAHVNVERVNFGGNMLTKLAENLRSLILSQRIKLYQGAGALPVKTRMEDLADELLDLQIIHKGNAWCWGHSATGHDDRCFPAGTMITTIFGDVPIEDIRVGDWVLTRAGFRPVVMAGCTGEANTVTMEAADGRRLTGTANHPIYTHDGWLALRNVHANTIIHVWKHKSSSMACCTTATPIPRTKVMPGIFRHTQNGKERCGTCTETCGKLLMVQSRQGSKSITRMVTSSTTPWTTLSWSVPKNTPLGMSRRWSNCDVSSAERNMRQSRHGRRSIAQSLAITKRDIWQSEGEFASFVDESLRHTSTAQLQLVPVSVRGVCESGKQKVYNLSVAGQPEYFANGILVHNCAVLAMAALSIVKDRPNLPEVVILADIPGESDLPEVEEIVWKKPGLDLTCWN